MGRIFKNKHITTPNFIITIIHNATKTLKLREYIYVIYTHTPRNQSINDYQNNLSANLIYFFAK